MLRRWMKAPRLDVGHRSADGSWRPNTRISDTVFIDYPERVRFGDRVFVWHYSILDGVGGIEIGEGSQIGAWVGIFTHSSHVAVRLYGRHYEEVPSSAKTAYGIAPVRIGSFTFVGARSVILPGVTIGSGCIIGAGSMVTKDVPDFAIVAGSPAVQTGDTRRLDRRYLAANPQLAEYYLEWSSHLTSAETAEP